MASASASAPGVSRHAVHGAVAPLRAGEGTSFLLRRLHSLTGIVPVGAFLFEHILVSNSTAIGQNDREESTGDGARINSLKVPGADDPKFIATPALGGT